MDAYLPYGYPRQIKILEKAAASMEGFESMVFPDFVGRYGLDHFEVSMKALERFTPLGSSELGVRPFFVAHADATLRQALKWTHHGDPHVRRLASEGCRPRLPWAPALVAFKRDPLPILPILDALKADPSEYVRRSVANNLNDIAKDHPDVVLRIAREWRGTNPLTDWIVRHGCRSLLTAGHPQVLALFGYGGRVTASVSGLRLSPRRLRIGHTLEFAFSLDATSTRPRRLRLEYAIHFMKASGRRSVKVFQIAEKEFAPGAIEISRRHGFQDLTTRKHYPGEHLLAVIVNGREQVREGFMLRAGS
jgi:3-methyladenine DNA glycosylase AlkC